MKRTVKEKLSSGLPLFLVPLIGLVASCATPTEPGEPAISPKLVGEAKAGVVASYSRAISISYTQVPNTDQKNFPVLVSGTYDGTNGTADLRWIGNTSPATPGKVRSSNGYDVGFYTNSNCSSGKMKWETEQYNG